MKNTETRLAEIEIEMALVRTEVSIKEENDPCDSWDEFCEYMKPEWDKMAELDRERRMIMTPVFERDVPDYGDEMSLEEFIECVKEGGFIDYDGSGEYAKDGKMSGITIHPSDVKHKAIRKDFDTIIWFNK